MGRLSEHHDLSLMLLVGRSLSTGSPWSFDDERVLISQERELWAALTEDERQQEQIFLAQLWANRGASRTVQINPAWGEWAANLPSPMVLPDSAFGMSSQGFRPHAKGLSLDEHPDFNRVLKWLWLRGFQVVGLNPQARKLTILIPNNRIAQEADRLLTLLVRFLPGVKISPAGSGDGVQLQSVYDPVSGNASIELLRLDDTVLSR